MELSEKEVQELLDRKISIEELNDLYFIKSQYRVEVENILKLLNSNICSFKDIVDKFKSIKDHDNDPSLYELLNNKELFQELIKNNRLSTEDLRDLLNEIDKTSELYILRENTSLLKHIVDIVSFKELVDKHKSIKGYNSKPCLFYLLGNEELFEELIKNNKLNTEDLRYLLDTIDDYDDLYKLCYNNPLIKFVLNEFVLNREDVDKFNRLLENSNWCKDHNIHTVFDWIEYENKDYEEILKLNELNKKVCLLTNFDLTDEQKLEIHEILRNNEIARNTLIQIINNHLEDQYKDFETLKNLLTKDSEKKKNKLNF